MRRLPAGVPIVTAAAMRAAEDATIASGLSRDVLMKRAGAAVAVQVARLAAGRPVLVLAGPGNNGGDGYVAARWLAERGHDVIVAEVSGKAQGSAARMRLAWQGETIDLAAAEPRAVLVDGLFGTGLSRPLDPAVAMPLARLRRAAALTIAIDLPSGIGSDDGADLGSAGADVTVALGALKPGHVLDAGVAACGSVLIADIGILIASTIRTIDRPVLTAPPADAHKFSRGMVAVVAGAMPGAAWLAATAAAHGGAGYVVLAGRDPPGGTPHAVVRRPTGDPRALAQLLDDDRIGCVVVGPGLGRDDAARAMLDAVLASPRDVVIDGDALSLLGRAVAARIDAGRRRVCLTPHGGEFARMFDHSGGKIAATVAAARESGAIIVHKGADTVIAGPDGGATISAAASGWLSTAGSGDVLAGLIAARSAAGGGAADACAAAVWLHARAARHAGIAFTADELANHIPAALADCRWA